MIEAAQDVVVERRGSQLWITLNRPQKANAMTVGMMEQATSAMAHAATEDGVSAIVLTGAGERVFTAGVDVREAAPDGDARSQRAGRSAALAALQDAVLDTPKPVVAVLNGAAVGAGAMLALIADACVAVEGSALALPEIDIGIASFSGASILEAIGGRALALDLIQGGRKMPASEAAVRGLVRAMARRDELATVAAAQADLLGAKDRAAFAANKLWINRALKAALGEARAEHARHRAAAGH